MMSVYRDDPVLAEVSIPLATVRFISM